MTAPLPQSEELANTAQSGSADAAQSTSSVADKSVVNSDSVSDTGPMVIEAATVMDIDQGGDHMDTDGWDIVERTLSFSVSSIIYSSSSIL